MPGCKNSCNSSKNKILNRGETCRSHLRQKYFFLPKTALYYVMQFGVHIQHVFNYEIYPDWDKCPNKKYLRNVLTWNGSPNPWIKSVPLYHLLSSPISSELQRKLALSLT